MQGADTLREGARAARQAERTELRGAELLRRRLHPAFNPPRPASAATMDVHEIASRLKTSTAVSVEDLAALKNGLIVSESKVSEFLQQHGALRGLVRELTGSDTAKQTLAVACFCNLALSEVKSTQLIAKAVGPYLLPCLDSLNRELAVTSAWTLGNLAGSSSKVCDILITQGAMSKLICILSDTTDDEIEEAVVYALVHFVYILKNELRYENLSQLFHAVSKVRRNYFTYHLLYLLSCHTLFSSVAEINNEFLTSRMEEFNYKESIEGSSQNHCLEKTLYTVRILANICVTSNGCDNILQLFKNCKYYSALENMFSCKSEVLRKSLLWLLGNIYNFSTNCDDKVMFFKSICDII